MNVVWFKRDLRIEDHEPLLKASQNGACLCLYVYEPTLINSAEFDTSHLNFINESLAELDQRLQTLGAKLTYRVGNVVDVLETLRQRHGIDSLFSHEETGNRLTFDRDKAVRAWAEKNRIPWKEVPQTGVVRRLPSRNGWSKQRNTWLKQSIPQTATKLQCPADIDPERIYLPADFGLNTSKKVNLPKGGSLAAADTLRSFLEDRGENYKSEMSSPVTAWTSCSRLSPYLAYGCVSIKTVVNKLKLVQAEWRDQKNSGRDTGNWLASLKSFESRLSWHCHFMQKLEDQPSLEFENMSRAYDGLREEDFNQARFDAWCAGQTGYPMIDACMRALHKQSWINFRMRAMLVSFASYHLWLHWRPTAVFLAKHFLDFEPGIHFSQFQMQSGTTGINTVRIYSPIKQVADQDPHGKFIREFVPELREVPDEHLAEPHKMPRLMQDLVGCRIGKDYPEPIVDHKAAYRSAKDRIFALRKSELARAEAQDVFQKHGSRKRNRSG